MDDGQHTKGAAQPHAGAANRTSGRAFRSDVTISHVAGLTASSARGLGATLEGEFSRWKMSSSASGDATLVRFEFDCGPGGYPASSYSKWHSEWTAALKCWDRPLVWKPQAKAGE